jgi:hypothetical protein
MWIRDGFTKAPVEIMVRTLGIHFVGGLSELMVILYTNTLVVKVKYIGLLA